MRKKNNDDDYNDEIVKSLIEAMLRTMLNGRPVYDFNRQDDEKVRRPYCEGEKVDDTYRLLIEMPGTSEEDIRCTIEEEDENPYLFISTEDGIGEKYRLTVTLDKIMEIKEKSFRNGVLEVILIEE